MRRLTPNFVHGSVVAAMFLGGVCFLAGRVLQRSQDETMVLEAYQMNQQASMQRAAATIATHGSQSLNPDEITAYNELQQKLQHLETLIFTAVLDSDIKAAQSHLSQRSQLQAQFLDRYAPKWRDH